MAKNPNIVVFNKKQNSILNNNTVNEEFRIPKEHILFTKIKGQELTVYLKSGSNLNYIFPFENADELTKFINENNI